MTENPDKYAHFKGKEALEHVAEMQAEGMISASEIHGTELPGHISAGTDAGRETVLLMLLLWTILSKLSVSNNIIVMTLFIFALGFLVWKTGRSAWLGWSRLERLHRVLGQEKWEIEHNRLQERDELRALYALKGFEGKLLEDVLDVLMADEERLLRVMVEEELGLSLQSHEHPLKQALGAFTGTIISAVVCFFLFFFFNGYGIITGTFLVIALSATISAYYEDNRIIPAIVWNLGLGVFSFAFVYFLMDFIKIQ